MRVLTRILRQLKRSRAFGVAAVAALVAVSPAMAVESVEWNGFALIRPETPTKGAPFDDDSLNAQVQVGLDWRPSPAFGAHVHLLARNDDDGSQRGLVGVVEAYLEQNVRRGSDRVHLMEGAFFLPTSRENVDSLWESPYTISSSALNTWLGEEFRPIGVDLAWTHRFQTIGAFTAGVTAFTGNDTFGALPIDRGWTLRDDWALLGEHIPVNATSFTSVSAETDHRLGWAARARWSIEHGSIQLTRIDNRSDALRHDDLSVWDTQFNIAGANYTWHDWTVLAETGWGTTAIQGRNGRATRDIRASYLLLSRKIAAVRASARADQYESGVKHGHAVTADLFWERSGRLRPGIEAITADGQHRVEVELRYHF